MVHLSHLLFALLASLSSVSNVSGTVHEILCIDGVGDTAAFRNALRNASPGDVILLNPCEYNFPPDYYFENDQPTNPLFAFNSTIRNEAGIIIKGMGEDAGDTVLKAVMHYLNINLLLENLTLTAEGTTMDPNAVFQADHDLANVFNSCIIKSNDDSGPYDHAMRTLLHKVTLINSSLINTNTVNDASSNVGIIVLAYSTYRFGLMNSKIDGFWAGLRVINWDLSPETVDSVNLWNADLSTNNYECCTEITNPKNKRRTRKESVLSIDQLPRRKAVSAEMNQIPRKRKTQQGNLSTCTENCPTSQQKLNTPIGNNKFIYQNINLMSGDNIFMAFHIKFKRVVTAGQTIVYKLPSAYPDLPPNYISGTTAQYYRFHSTAKLRKQKRTLLFFKKGVMDSNFANPSTIKVFMYFENTGTFGNNPLQHTTVTKNGVEFYKVRMPKRKRFNLMIAFGEEE